MKRFEFSLERIRRYKQQLLDLEKGRLSVLQRQLAELDEKILNLSRDRSRRLEELQRQQFEGVFAEELQRGRFFLENERIQIQQLTIERKTLKKQIDLQIEKVVAASQETKSIDKLKEKQQAEYQQEEIREKNEEISELVMLSL